MPDIRVLGIDEMKRIYTEYMEKDFPRGELRPFSAIKKCCERGEYRGYGFYDGDRFLAYAYFYLYAGSKQALLDYFAVVPKLRDRGVGSAFLRAMIPDIPKGCGILIEAESADSAKNEESRRERERRIAFYERNGAHLTGVRCLLFMVDYEIMMLPSPEDAAPESATKPQDYFEMTDQMYQNLYSPIFGKLCKLYIP